MIKKIGNIILVLTLFSQVSLWAQRDTIPMNRYWYFNYLPYDELDASFFEGKSEEDKWIDVSLPHTWSTYETTKEEHPYIKDASERINPYWWKGWGYYKKEFLIDSIDLTRKLFIEFDGVQKYCHVFINGHMLGDHKGGYTSFYFDISKYAKKGKNEIWVAVSNIRDDSFGGIPPMSAGNFNVYGGIYRDVRIVIKNKVHIPYQGSYLHDGGTFITPVIKDSSKALIQIKTFIQNDDKNANKIKLVSHIIDPFGREIQNADTSILVENSVLTNVYQSVQLKEKPLLWSPENPNLYTLKSEIIQDGEILERYTSNFGLRWFWWNYETNILWLNGTPVHIHGTNRHQEYPWLGDAIPKWLMRRDMLDIKNKLGHNFMRTGHYPNDPYIYKLADSLGIIVVEEVPNIKDSNFGEDIQKDNLTEMIRRDRNHPSIFFWSMGNETNDAADSKWAWEEDTTRILHQRKTEGYGDFVSHNQTNLDMENLLRVTVRGWFNKDVKNLEPKNSPEVPKSGQYAGTEEWQHKMARVKDGSIRGRIDENIVAWLYEDHGCDRIYKDAPLKYINYKGWVDSYRVPKYMYFLWQANYAPFPMVKIMPHYWQNKYIGSVQDLIIDSNCEKVALWSGDKFYGFQYPENNIFHSLIFENILIEDDTLIALGYIENTIVNSDSLFISSKPQRLNLRLEYENLCADKTSVILAWVDVLDESGRKVLGANPDLHWHVKGEGTLIGSDVYSSDINKTSAKEGQGYTITPVFNIIRTTNSPGKIQISVSSQDLESDTITVFSSNCQLMNEWIKEIIPELENQNIQILEETPEDFKILTFYKNINSNVTFQKDENNDYSDQLKRWLNKYRTKELSQNSEKSDHLLSILNKYLIRMKGELIADDYNFLINRYNQVYSFVYYLEHLHLQDDFTSYISDYFIKKVLINAESVELGKFYKELAMYGREGQVIEFRKSNSTHKEGTYEHLRTQHKTIIYTSNFLTGLKLCIPEFKKLTETEHEKYINKVILVNPELNEINHHVNIKYETPYFIFSINREI